MMITILLLLFYFSQSSTTAIPLFSTSVDILARNASTLLPVGTPVCTCPDQRSIWDIVWSCLATILACTWVAVHPDIPDPDEKWWLVTLRRVELVVWTLLTPELVIFWAMRQWHGARNIAEGQKDKGWGRTHGYFIQMGGFMLYNGDKMMGTLSYPRFIVLLAEKRIDFPTITQEEINDRSKSDGLAKLLVISQTGWFILQCTTRSIEKLPITELELATLAFAALNGCMYFFWWNKPFDVRAPVQVKLRKEKSDKSVVTDIGESEAESILNSEGNEENSALIPQADDHSDVEEPLPYHWNAWIRVITWPWTILEMVFRRLDALLTSRSGSYVFFQFENPKRPEAEIGPKGVPTFYGLRAKDNIVLFLAISIIGSIFGAIHCTGWFFHFPTVTELWFWRISSLYIAVYPILTIVISFIGDILFESESAILRAYRDTLFRPVYSWWVSLGDFPYIIARFLLLAECLTTLRDLPPGAYDVVQWTICIPHI